MSLVLNIVCIVIAIIITIFIGYDVFKTIKNKLTDNDIASIKEWLLYAVMIAEQELGNKTGELKLSYVYTMFIEAFPKLSQLISMDMFNLLVDETLDKLNDLLEANFAIGEYVYKIKGDN